MKVLLAIADDPAVRESLRAGTDIEDVLIAETSVDGAARRLVAIRVDVLLLDDSLRQGADALTTLRAVAPRTPIVVLSSRGDLATQAALRKAGADDVLHKPFSVEALRHTLRRVATGGAPAPAPMSQTLPAPSAGDSLAQHRMALRWISRATACCGDPQRLAERLVEGALDIFDAVRCAVLLESAGRVRVAASQGVADSVRDTLSLGYDCGLMRCLDEQASLYVRGTVPAQEAVPRERERPEAERQLCLLGGCLAAPLMRGGRVFGALVLGEKATATGYTREEHELLALVARCASLLFERANAGDAPSLHEAGPAAVVLEHLPQGVVLVGTDECVRLVNTRAASLLGAPASRLIGRPATELGADVAAAFLDALADASPRRHVLAGAAGGLSVTLQTEPVLGVGVLGVLEAGEVSATPQRAGADRLEASPFWEYLSSRVAQEIKNPMVAINTFAQLLPRKYDSEEFRDAFSRVVQKEVQRINGVVETLFAFARPPKPQPRNCSVNETVRDVLRAFEDELAARHIALETKWDETGPQANLDPIYFSQALHNIVQNAIDAMPEGGRIRVETRRENGSAEVLVTDTGPGIRPEDEPHIFLPFYSTKERGMGLGLSIADRILQHHDASLRLHRNAEGGGGFLIHLPVQPAGNRGPRLGAPTEQ